MTGFLHLIVPASRFRLLQGGEALSTYTFNTGVAKHLFCATCGVKSFYVPRSNPDGYSVNLRCLDTQTIESLHVRNFDGRNWEMHAQALEHLSKDFTDSPPNPASDPENPPVMPPRRRYRRSVAGTVLVLFAALWLFMDYRSSREARVQVAVAIQQANDYQREINDYFRAHGKMPGDLQELVEFGHDLTPVAADAGFSVSIDGYRLNYRFQAPDALAGHNLLLAAEPVGNRLRWTCGGGTVPSRYRPPNCR